MSSAPCCRRNSRPTLWRGRGSRRRDAEAGQQQHTHARPTEQGCGGELSRRVADRTLHISATTLTYVKQMQAHTFSGTHCASQRHSMLNTIRASLAIAILESVQDTHGLAVAGAVQGGQDHLQVQGPDHLQVAVHPTNVPLDLARVLSGRCVDVYACLCMLVCVLVLLNCGMLPCRAHSLLPGTC